VTKSEYAEYLQTPEWRARRENKIIAAGRKCQVCSSHHGLEVHHNSYESLDIDHPGAELDCDLVVLCARCHAVHHVPDIESDGEAFWPVIRVGAHLYRGLGMQRVDIHG